VTEEGRFFLYSWKSKKMPHFHVAVFVFGKFLDHHVVIMATLNGYQLFNLIESRTNNNNYVYLLRTEIEKGMFETIKSFFILPSAIVPLSDSGSGSRRSGSFLRKWKWLSESCPTFTLVHDYPIK